MGKSITSSVYVGLGTCTWSGTNPEKPGNSFTCILRLMTPNLLPKHAAHVRVQKSHHIG
jgi:hypothetical protein